MAAGDTYKLGPGTLTIGATGTEFDASCLVNNCTLAADKDEGDSVTKLCGDVVPGSVTYSYTLSGNADIDISDPDGLFMMSQEQKGAQLPFVFTPNTEAGNAASGTLVLDPLDFGGDETGEIMTSDFEFTVVGDPTFTITPPVGGTAAEEPAA